jgi:hypothetical protein
VFTVYRIQLWKQKEFQKDLPKFKRDFCWSFSHRRRSSICDEEATAEWYRGDGGDGILAFLRSACCNDCFVVGGSGPSSSSSTGANYAWTGVSEEREGRV